MVSKTSGLRFIIAGWLALLATDLFAQDQSAIPLWNAASGESYWLSDNPTFDNPVSIVPPYWSSVTKAGAAASPRSTYQFVKQHQVVTDEQVDPSASPSNPKAGTGLDSLPSFRGIKGIKNLPGGVGTLFMANPHASFAAYPSQSTDQPGTSLSMNRYDFQGAVPLGNYGPHTFVLTGDVEVTSVSTNAILPTSNQAFPSAFYNISMGMNYFHQFESGTVGGFVFDIGSASDKPFESSRDLLASGTGFLLIPHTEQGSWFVGVNASTNSQVLHGIPIPGGGYFFHPNDDFQAVVGLPFSLISWKFTRDWTFQFVYAFLTTTHTRISYQPTQKWQIYAGFDWTNENWDRAERQNEEDHFFYYEKKLALGYLWWFHKNVGLDISGGYAFDRYFTEVNGFSLKGDNTVNVNSGAYVAAQLSLRF